jgi:predicted RNA polymerase sigma factor
VKSLPLAPDAERLLRDIAPQVLGAVLRRFRDFTACEDAVQEALIAAAVQWPREGIPGNPRGWLIQVALRRMSDHVRSEISRRNREAVVAEETPGVVAPTTYSEREFDPDDALVLLFMCCHPALSPGSAIALTPVRAHLLERAGEREAAVALHRVAAAKTTSIPERNYLMLRAAHLNQEPTSTSAKARAAWHVVNRD